MTTPGQALATIAATYPISATSGPVTTASGTFAAVLHATSQYSGSTLDIYAWQSGSWAQVGSLVNQLALQEILGSSPLTVAYLTGGSSPDFVASTAMADGNVTAVAADIGGKWILVPFSPTGGGLGGVEVLNGTVQGMTIVSSGTSYAANPGVGAATYQYESARHSFVAIAP